MTGDFIGNASGFEILFLLSALIGTWFSRKNVREAWTDYHVLGGITNGRRAVAMGAIVTETILLSNHALYILVAMFAITRPAPDETSPTGVLILSILVFVSWGMTAISIVSRRVRLYLLKHGMSSRDANGRFIKEK